ncbi:MAG: hypothetical protein AB7O28_15945 [Vicinamibacterales bacterium]
MILLPLAAVVGYSLVLARTTRWPVATAPLAVVCAVITLLFAAGLAGAMPAARTALVWGGLAGAAAVGLAAARRPRRMEASTLLAPGLVVFVVLVVVHWLRARGAPLAQWDEFAQWGLQSKVITLSGALVSADSAVEFKDYPTGAAIFHYFVNGGTGYDEGGAIAAHGALTLAAMATVVQGAPWRRTAAVLAAVAVAYQLVYLFGQGFDSLLIDQVLGAVFGGALATAFLSGESRPVAAARTVPCLLALPLIKEIGLQFALVAAGALIVDLGLDALRPVGGGAGRAPAFARWRRTAAVAMLLIAAPLAAKAGWDHHRRAIHAGDTFAPPSPVAVLRRAFSAGATPRDRVTIDAFGRALEDASLPIADALPIAARLHLVEPSAWLPVTTATAVALLLALSAAGWALLPPGPARHRAAVAGVCLAGGFAAYVVGHLAAYLEVFSEYEGTRVISFDRYMRTYLLGWGLVGLGFLTSAACSDSGRRAARPVLFLLAAASVILLPARAVALLLHGPPPMQPIRAAMQAPIAEVREAAGPTGRVYLIFQYTTGFEHWVAKYELAPRRSNLRCWSVGTPAGAEDVWTCPLTPDALGQELAGYDVLFVGKAEENFWSAYGGLFPPGDSHRAPAIFAIRRAVDGHAVLERIGGLP